MTAVLASCRAVVFVSAHHCHRGVIGHCPLGSIFSSVLRTATGRMQWRCCVWRAAARSRAGPQRVARMVITAPVEPRPAAWEVTGVRSHTWREARGMTQQPLSLERKSDRAPGSARPRPTAPSCGSHARGLRPGVPLEVRVASQRRPLAEHWPPRGPRARTLPGPEPGSGSHGCGFTSSRETTTLGSKDAGSSPSSSCLLCPWLTSDFCPVLLSEVFRTSEGAVTLPRAMVTFQEGRERARGAQLRGSRGARTAGSRWPSWPGGP